MAKCEACGQTIRKTAKRKATISLGKGPSRWVDQGKEYAANMKVKRGELLWDDTHPGHGFGSRGGFVTPDEYLARRLPTDELKAAVECGQLEMDMSTFGAILRDREREQARMRSPHGSLFVRSAA